MIRKLYYNGHILTMNDTLPEAEYVLTEGERIVAVGMGTYESDLAEDIERIDLQGKTMLPGFIDSHIHMLTAALNCLKLDVTDKHFDSVRELLLFVRSEKEGSAEQWISVFGFSEENIDTQKMVTRADIDEVFPDVPVTIIRVDGHMCIINSRAIEQLDSQKMAQIAEGAFLTDENGVYNGMATEGAQQYVLDSMPSSDETVVMNLLQEQQQMLLQKGITAIHDAGTDMMLPKDYVQVFESFHAQKRLKLRTYLMIRPEEGESVDSFHAYVAKQKAVYADDPYLRIGAVKLFADGSFGSRTAAVEMPYESQPDNVGLLLTQKLDYYIKAAVEAGNQVAVHCIGDRSTGYVLEKYCTSKNVDSTRQRVEHAELLNERLISTLRDRNILLMTQPIFIREFGNTYFNNLGQERAMQIQPLHTLLKNGVKVGFGTDYPVDDPDPLLGITAAMTRCVKNSERILNEAERISFAEAVRCYTLQNAYAAFWEQEIGSIEVGKYADFVVLSGLCFAENGDVMVPEKAHVTRTVVGGETLYLEEIASQQ